MSRMGEFCFGVIWQARSVEERRGLSGLGGLRLGKARQAGSGPDWQGMDWTGGARNGEAG